MHLAVDLSHGYAVRSLSKIPGACSVKNRAGNTALHLAASYGRVHCMDALLQSPGVDLNGQNGNGSTPLHSAIDSMEYGGAIADQLIQAGAKVDSVNSHGQTPLHCACCLGHYDITEQLIESGAVVNKVDHSSQMPLHYACTGVDPRIVDKLVRSGATISPVNKSGITPLHYACMSGNMEIIELLLKSGADTTATDKIGRTPLHMSAWKGWHDCIKAVVEHGGDVNARTFEQRTPLHFAASEGYTLTAAELLSHGAVKMCKDEVGLSPEDHARQSKHGEMVVFFSMLDTPLDHLEAHGYSRLREIVEEVGKSIVIDVDNELPIPESPGYN